MLKTKDICKIIDKGIDFTFIWTGIVRKSKRFSPHFGTKEFIMSKDIYVNKLRISLFKFHYTY